MASIADQLMERRAALINQAQDIAQKGVTEGRELTVEENTAFEGMISEAGTPSSGAKSIHEGEERAHDLENSFRNVTGKDPEKRGGEVDGAFGSGPERPASATSTTSRPSVAPRNAPSRPVAWSPAPCPPPVVSRPTACTASSGSTRWPARSSSRRVWTSSTPPTATPCRLPVATVHATTGTANAALPVAISANGVVTLNDATLTTVNLTVAKYGYLTLVPTELVQDTTFDLEGYISQAAGRELPARSPTSRPPLRSPGSPPRVSPARPARPPRWATRPRPGMGSDLIYQLYHSVLPEYRSDAAFVMNDLSAAQVRMLKSTTSGAGVWQPALTAGDPDLLVGKPVYTPADRDHGGQRQVDLLRRMVGVLKVRIAGGIRFERSSEYAFGNDQVAFRALVRTGAVTVDPNAVKHLANSAL